MGYHKIHAVLIIPATLLTQATNFLRKHGLGTGHLHRALIRKTDPDNQAPRGYAAIMRLDEGGWAVIKKAVEGRANCYVFADMRKRQAAASALNFIDSKGFRIKPNG